MFMSLKRRYFFSIKLWLILVTSTEDTESRTHTLLASFTVLVVEILSEIFQKFYISEAITHVGTVVGKTTNTQRKFGLNILRESLNLKNIDSDLICLEIIASDRVRNF